MLTLECTELSWYQAPPLEEHYDGGLFLRTLSDCHSQDAPVATGSKYRGCSLSMSTGSGDHPIDLTSETPRMAFMESVSIASRSGCSVISSESAHSTINLSAYSSSFPVVPPASDQMIEALSLGLERDYHEALILSSASSSSSSASSSRSDLFDGCTATSSYLGSGRTTPDTEWESISLSESTPTSLVGEQDSEGPTVRLVPSSGSISLDLLPSLRKWAPPPS